jgi:hypothetical protein
MQTSTSVIGRTFVVRTNVSTRLCRPNAGIRPLSKVSHKAIMIANTSKAREREQRVGQTMGLVLGKYEQETKPQSEAQSLNLW